MYSLSSKRFRLVSEQRKTEKWGFSVLAERGGGKGGVRVRVRVRVRVKG